jgi:acetyl esterase/lipase
MTRVAPLVFAATFLLPATARPQGRVEINVVYGMHSGTALLLDVHYPAAPNGLAIILVPGSGWSSDPEYGATSLKDGAQPRQWVPPLTRAGYTVFVPNHRAAPAFHYPAPVEDLQRAVRFVRHHGGRFKIDPTRIGGMGGSSGGHLIAMMGMMDGAGIADDRDPVNRHSAKLQTLVLRAAPVDLRLSPGPAVGAFLTMAPPGPTAPPMSVAARRYEEASPLSYVTRDDPPTLMLHGDADPIVPHQHATVLHSALQKVGRPSKVVTIPRGAHGPAFGQADGAARPSDWPDYMAEMVRWFDEFLKNKKGTN